jgi:uncharacterized protein YdbL (DUF1318 family)
LSVKAEHHQKGGKRVMKRGIILSSIILLIVAACVTVNIYFPAAEIQKAADKIVGDVRGKTAGETPEEKPPAQEGDKQGLFNSEHFLAKSAYAQMNIDITTPAIRSLKESLKARFSQLKGFYDAGRIGEANNGIVATRDMEGLGLKEKATLLRLVDEENKDRTSLYTEILKANNQGTEHIGEVEKIFARSWQKDSPQGWWIQTEKGEWIKKQ